LKEMTVMIYDGVYEMMSILEALYMPHETSDWVCNSND
jgi:hypothetical protein